MIHPDHSNVVVRIAEGTPSSFVRCKTKPLPWGGFVKRLAEPQRDRMKTKSFLKLPVSEQGRVKGAAGWFVGGPVEDGQRKRKNVLERDALTFDIDGCATHVFLNLIEGFSSFCRYEWALSTTRKHTEDAPRFRLVLPLKDPCPVGLYEPVMRILGAELDPTLDGIDDVSFRPSQLMYWPTKGPDTEYVFFHNRGELVDPETVLAGYPLDWRDYANLPFSEKRSAARRKADKAENPLEKKGIIGAFCRAYTIEEAIAEFLPDVYTPDDSGSSDPRYTYVEGSVAGGAIVYDNGLHLYSHHDTDPAGHQNLNAWDLMRLHLYGDLDAKVPEDTQMSKRPSFKAMDELARSKDEVLAELVKDRYDLTAMFEDADNKQAAEVADESDDFEDLYNEVIGRVLPSGVPEIRRRKKPKKPKKDWRSEDLEYDKWGRIKPTLHNSATLIANDPRMWGVIGLNGFSNKITARRTLKSRIATVPTIWVDDEKNGVPWSDTHDASIRALLEAPAGRSKPGWSYRISARDIKDAICLVAERWRFHPVQEYFEGLVWDDVDRVERLWIEFLGLPDTPYARQTARLFIIAVIARVYCPGHKWDYVPILSGPQGIRKSTFIKALVGDDWAGELTVEMASNKDAVEQMLGKLCLELPELAHMRMGHVTKVKEFITLQIDSCRLSYDRRMSDFPRQCVFMGTSNENEYLKDPTGNRRFWPMKVTVPMIDTDRVIELRDQIWAEGYRLWCQMCHEHAGRTGNPNAWQHLPLTLHGEAAVEAERLQEMAREEDSIAATAETIRAWLDKPVPLSELLNPDDKTNVFTDDDEPMALRVRTCPRQAYCEGLGVTVVDLAKNKSLETSSGSALGAVEGWRKTGRKSMFAQYGRCHEYVREDATPKELAKGYRIIAVREE